MEITGRPYPTVKWTLNDKVLDGTEEHISIKTYEKVHVLRIEKANIKQAGEVVVMAENPAGVVGKSVVLKVSFL